MNRGRYCEGCGVDWLGAFVFAVIIVAVILFWIAAVTYAMRALAAAAPPACTESGLVASGPDSGIGTAIICTDP